jgi:sugar porter (SP) family MFS transporter
MPQNLVQFYTARMLSGVAIGISSMICPVYIAEIAPPAWRGRLGTLFQLGIVVGVMVTLFINAKIQTLGGLDWNVRLGWRWMLVAETIPALLLVGLLVPIPESPKWLIQAGREPEARRTLLRIGGPAYADAEVAAVREVLAQEEGSFAELFSRDYRLPLLLAFTLMIGGQLSGINAIIYYSTDLFLAATGDINAAFHRTVWIGLVNLLATLVAISLVDKAGRRPLLLLGNSIQVVALIAIGGLYATNPSSLAPLGPVLVYAAAFNLAMGPLPWVVCSEIFPAKLRGRAMSVSTFCIWVGCLMVTISFPYLRRPEHVGLAGTFWLYAACSAATLLVVFFFLPETKGKSLEEIEKSWRRSGR